MVPKMTLTTMDATGMYSARIASRIARVRPQNFQAWIKANLLQPHRVSIGDQGENTYTYDDLLLMRLIVKLKKDGATPKSIRVALDTIAYMNEGSRSAWKNTHLLVDEGMVVVIFPDKSAWNPIAASRGSQKMAEVFFPELIEELRNELIPSDRFKHIEIDPEVLGGAPVIKGTRISTRSVMSVLESGCNPREAYPSLSDEQIAEVEDYEHSFLQAA